MQNCLSLHAPKEVLAVFREQLRGQHLHVRDMHPLDGVEQKLPKIVETHAFPRAEPSGIAEDLVPARAPQNRPGRAVHGIPVAVDSRKKRHVEELQTRAKGVQLEEHFPHMLHAGFATVN